MRYLVDTDWVAEFLVERAPAVAKLQQLAPEGLGISLMTYGEIYEGVFYGRDPKRAEATFHAFIRGVDVLPLTRPILRRFASIRGELRRRGQIIGDPDILIAATAIHNGLQLVTRNVRHFERVPDLQLLLQSS